MLQIAGGILLAFFTLCYLPELLRATWFLIRLTALFAIMGAAYILMTGNY